MATAFTPQERETIRQALLRSAMERAASTGLRSTTIEQLARDAGISKAAFYKFYESKEHLFLAVLEALHAEMYGNAERVLAERPELPVPQRMTLAIHEVCSVLRKHRLSRFIEEDAPLVLRKLPPNLLAEHYRSDTELIRHLLAGEGFRLSIPLELGCTIVRMVLSTLIHERTLGPDYAQALDTVIGAVCDKVILA